MVKGVGVGVMTVVADLSREVRDEESRVEDEADNVIKEGGVEEGMVAALVGDDQNADEDAALGNPIEGPGGEAKQQLG